MKTKYLVVDTSAFIQNAPLHEIGENMVTVSDVIHEVRNKRQLRHLAALTYELEVKDVFAESVAFVTEFSKKTGDYPCLSATDLKVLALTYQLEKQYIGTDHIKTCPVVKRSVDYTNRSVINAKNIAGFYLPTKKVTAQSHAENETDIADKENKTQNEDLTPGNAILINQSNSDDEYLSAASYVSDSEDDYDNQKISLDFHDANDEIIEQIEHYHIDSCEEENISNNDESNLNSSTDDDNDSYYSSDSYDSDIENHEHSNYENEDDFSDEGWITPRNIVSVKRELNPGHFQDTAVTVGCITTDFAMQNVLKQMGLNVIALDGRIIKEMRTFILRCYACFKTTSNMRKSFCPHCGNKTLKRVAVSLDKNGNQQIHINIRKPLTARGKRYPLPAPKSGKHAVNPRLVEDARRPHQKPTRLAKTKTDALHPDYIAEASPFAMRDVHSRSARLGFAHGKPVVEYWMKRNPNESKRTSKKKK